VISKYIFEMLYLSNSKRNERFIKYPVILYHMGIYQKIIVGGLIVIGLAGILGCDKNNSQRKEYKPNYSQSVNVKSQGDKNNSQREESKPNYSQSINTQSKQGYGGAIALDLGDVNSDGIQELVLGDLKSVKLYRNDGKGNFTNPQTITPVQSQGYYSGAIDLKLKDIDRDGDLDLIVGDLYGVLIFYNDGKGNFSQ
jgi:hypothetical protein